MQLIRMGTGSAEQATTAFEAMLRTLQDADKVKFLTRSGIKVFEDDGTTMRAIDDLMKDIVRATGGDPLKLSLVFDAEAMRAFNVLGAEFRRTGGFGTLERMKAAQGKGFLEADAARLAKMASAVTTAAASAVGKKIEEGITPAMKLGADFVRTAMEDGFGTAWEKNVLAPWRENRARLEALPLTERARLVAEEAAKAGIDLGPSGFERFAGPAGGRPGAGIGAFLTEYSWLAKQLSAQAPQGTVTIKVETEPGTRARVTGLQGRGLDVDTGPMMPESAR
jgi:hypothetical protein